MKLIAEYASMFRCPLCSGPMQAVHTNHLECDRRHCFDLSRHGYANMLTRPPKSKYGKSLFDGRRMVCKSGFFEPLNIKISEKITRFIQPGTEPVKLLDAGCGEGSPLSDIQDKVGRSLKGDILGVGLDIAKEGVYSAARQYPHAIWCVADLAKCPLADNQFHVILNILSPSNYSEFERMMTDDGTVMKVIPDRDYLKELRDIFYGQTDKPPYSNERSFERFKAHFKLLDMERIRYRAALGPTLIEPLIRMTPLSWGAAEERLQEAQQALEKHSSGITVDLTLLCGKKRR